MPGSDQRVFTAEWLENLRARYGQMDRHTRPLLYFIATEPDFAELRHATESGLALVSENARHRVIQNLRSPKNFQNTFNELVAGRILATRGLKLEYEKAYGDLTPDWFAWNDKEQFVVEVLTINTSDIESSQERQSSDLSGRLQKLKVDAAVGISVEDYSHPKLSPNKNKKIAREVDQWLTSSSLQVEDEFRIEELTFKLIHKNRGYTHLQLVGPARSFWVNSDPLRSKIEEKTGKYKRILREKKTGFILFVFATFQTCLGFDELEDVTVGKELFTIQYDEQTGQALNQFCHRKSNGLFSTETLLGGVYFIKINSNHRVCHARGLVNPGAEHPVMMKFDGDFDL